MSHHLKHTPDGTRVLIACSPGYANRGCLQRALASVFLDNIEAQREYYYYPCPALTEIFEDGILGGTVFHELMHGRDDAVALADIHFTHIMADRDNDFVQKLIDDIHAPHVTLIRLE